MNINGISKETGFDRKTVRTYIEKDNWFEKPGLYPANKRKSIPVPSNDRIDRWSEVDRQ